MGDCVISGADEPRASRDQLVASLAQFSVGFPDLEPEVIHANPAPAWDGSRILSDLDQEQFVMRASRRKGGGRKPDLLAGNRDLPPTQDVTIEAAGALELAHVEDEMAKLFDLQIDAPPPDSRSGYSKL